MPRENRKRGKKNKKKTEDFDKPESLPEPEVQSEVGPSWIIPSTAKEDDTNAEAPFGYVDTDVKAYFRTVDTQIRDWQDGEGEALVDENSDPNAGTAITLLCREAKTITLATRETDVLHGRTK